jgi:minor extracellular serine protease Vpr
VPWELAGQTSATVQVAVSDTTSAAVPVSLAAASPAIFELSNATAAAEDAQFHVITAAYPAQRGQVVHLFANGLGPVDTRPPDGAPAGAAPLSNTLARPTVTVGGVTASVSFSGLAPDFPALYQIDIVVPSNAPAGNDAVVVSLGGFSSPPVNMPVQ